ncbi:hypothetical protein FOMPIDRAFT_1049685 [Fomitopsis schrenkii]|uniref:Secreted protein n=1 Tax=Fomitopsis schrenkii TaxID=2126942 RepID=S8EAS1_FOMSC|nr:hypothetical protein FOMPIDRAFT_1049685 [Fomitopsis schrenkii]
MVATFILTRTFAVCALLVGAVPLAYAAPIDASASIQNIDERNCRILGCLRRAIPIHEVPNTNSDLLSATSDADDSGVVSSSAVGEVIRHVRPRIDPATNTASDSPDARARELDTEYAELLPEIDSLEK